MNNGINLNDPRVQKQLQDYNDAYHAHFNLGNGPTSKAPVDFTTIRCLGCGSSDVNVLYGCGESGVSILDQNETGVLPDGYVLVEQDNQKAIQVGTWNSGDLVLTAHDIQTLWDNVTKNTQDHDFIAECGDCVDECDITANRTDGVAENDQQYIFEDLIKSWATLVGIVLV
jgi:hypothetical protein